MNKKMIIVFVMFILTVYLTLASTSQHQGSFQIDNFPPVFDSFDTITVNLTDLVTITPNVTDPNGDTITFYYSSPLNSSGQWQTTINDEGIYNISINASDGVSNTTGYVIINVGNVTPPAEEEEPTVEEEEAPSGGGGSCGPGFTLVEGRCVKEEIPPENIVCLCHEPGTADEITICVPESAVEGFLQQGDSLGACVEEEEIEEAEEEVERPGLLPPYGGAIFQEPGEFVRDNIALLVALIAIVIALIGSIVFLNLKLKLLGIKSKNIHPLEKWAIHELKMGRSKKVIRKAIKQHKQWTRHELSRVFYNLKQGETLKKEFKLSNKDLEKLRDYIINHMKKGMDKAHVVKKLLKSGWDKNLINKLVNLYFH